MRRRSFITGVGGMGVGLAASTTMPAPAIAQGIRELKMVSTFVKNFPGLGTSANRLVERIRTASDGKLRIRLYNANELVGPLEVFDVVSKGDADIYFSSEYYYLGKSKAFGFFGAVPFGCGPLQLQGLHASPEFRELAVLLPDRPRQLDTRLVASSDLSLELPIGLGELASLVPVPSLPVRDPGVR